MFLVDYECFNITKDAEKTCTLVTTLGTAHPGDQNCSRQNWNMPIGSNTWNVALRRAGCKITIKPSNGTVAEGTWKCKYITENSHEYSKWKIAHIFEDRYGYLIHKIELEDNCKKSETYNVTCKKTKGEFQDASVLLYQRASYKDAFVA